MVDLLELAGEIAGGGGDGGDAEGGAVPDDAVVEFGDGEVEAVAELVFHGAETWRRSLRDWAWGISSSMVSLAMGIFSANEYEVDCHADADGGEDEAEDDGVAGDSAGLPGAGAELVNQLDVTEDGAEGDDDAEGDQSYSGPEREAGGAGWGGGIRRC